mgnify:CR=1 FL=1
MKWHILEIRPGYNQSYTFLAFHKDHVVVVGLVLIVHDQIDVQKILEYIIWHIGEANDITELEVSISGEESCLPFVSRSNPYEVICSS